MKIIIFAKIFTKVRKSGSIAMKSEDMITVVVPAHNAADTIGIVLNSLLGQTWPDWKCIVVDDCSSDSTAEIVKEFVRKYPARFKLIDGCGKGPYFARLAGVKASASKWVMFCDADDVLLPEAMETLISAADSSTNMVVGNVELVTPDGQRRSMSTIVQETWDDYISGYEYAKKVFGNEWFMSSYGKLMRRSAFSFADLESFEPYVMKGTLEDGLMMMLVSIGVEKIRLLPNAAVYEFRSSPNGPLKSFIPGANEFALFCSQVLDYVGKRFSDSDRAEVALYLNRMVYAMLIAKGVKISGEKSTYLKLMSALGNKSAKTEYHDKEIHAMLRVGRLRREVARRHAHIEAHLRSFFSVIVSAYNVGNVIERTISSVTKHNLFHRFEVIVVDDCSTDKTVGIVERITAEDKRVKLVRHERNKGLNATRLTGLSQATGEWVLFLDAGDRLGANLLTELHDHIRFRREIPEFQTDCVFFGIKCRSNRLPVQWNFWKVPEFKFDKKAVDSSMMFPRLLRKQGMPSALWNKAYRRSVLLDAAMTAEGKFYGEDHLTTLKIFNQKFHCSFLDCPGYVWYTGGGSHQSPEQQWESECDLAERTMKLLKDLHRDGKENLALIAESLHESLVENLARHYVGGVHGNERLQNVIDNMTSHPTYQQISTFANLQPPTPESVREHYASHRKAFIAKRWL